MTDAPVALLIDQIHTLLQPSCAGMTKAGFYSEIACRLSIVAAKSPWWTWRYILSVQSGTIKPSRRIDLAARVLLARLTGATSVPIYSPSETVQVHALPGTITPGAWVLSKSRPCANPACTVHFVPRVPWQKNCPLHTHRTRTPPSTANY